MARRGNRALFPENTLVAFNQAFSDGVDILETDLHLSSDDKFICILDATFNSTTNRAGEVRNLGFEEIKTLRILNAQSQPTKFQIPSLEEILEILPESIAIALELKTDRFIEPDICRRLGFILRKWNTIESSFCIIL